MSAASTHEAGAREAPRRQERAGPHYGAHRIHAAWIPPPSPAAASRSFIRSACATATPRPSSTDSISACCAAIASALLGKNGFGQDAFLKLLTGEIKADAGRVKLAKEIAFSYFDQARVALKPDQLLWRTLCPDGSDDIEVMESRHVCGYLKDFLFDPRLATAPVGTLLGW